MEKKSLNLNSLRSQLLLFVTLGMVLTFLIMGCILHSAYRSSLSASIEEQLRLKVFEILAAAQMNNTEIVFPSVLRNQQFNELGSGLYAFAYAEKKGKINQNMIWRSRSAGVLAWSVDRFIYPGSFYFSEKKIFNAVSQKEEDYFVFQYGVAWEWSQTNKKRFNIVLFHLADEYKAQLHAFEKKLWGWFFISVLSLVTLELFFLRQLLKPLKRMEDEISLIEKGEKEILSGFYPLELKKIVDNFNWLIQHERNQRERYKNNISDLSHALKTPLAGVFLELQSLSTNQDVAQKLIDEMKRIQDVIRYHTQKSFTLAHKWTTKSEVLPVVDRITQTLTKVYQEKNIKLEKEIDPYALFQGDEGDLMELLGNLIENAYKYSKSQVRIIVHYMSLEQDQMRELCVFIEDDGPGISSSCHDFVLERGVRLDSTALGQGIGLSIVKQIVQSYSAQIRINQSILGGARFEIRFPCLISQEI